MQSTHLKQITFLLAIAFHFIVSNGCQAQQVKKATLIDAVAGKYYIGTALNEAQIRGTDKKSVKLIKENFTAIVAENCMKQEGLQPQEGKFNFALSDKFVDFGQKNKLFTTGHTLIWHSQAAKWFFTDSTGKDVSRELLIQRMKTHILTVVSRYKGRIKGWDVVNEAIADDGSMRQTKYYEIIGPDYIKLAFQFAHEADPNAELYYNDYSMGNEPKRNAVVKMVKELQADGIRIDAIGMQGHQTLKDPTLENYEKSIKAFTDLGVKVMITEFDITVLPWPATEISAEVALSFDFKKEYDPYPKALPDSVATALHNRYLDFFRLFDKFQGKISRVTLWGVTDAQSWRNNWPVRGRTDYPLLFDRNYQPKPIIQSIWAIHHKK
jgi:endo-1,4-beta-xylanase